MFIKLSNKMKFMKFIFYSAFNHRTTKTRLELTHTATAILEFPNHLM